MARLRAALAERDERLKDSKAETSAARSALQVSSHSIARDTCTSNNMLSLFMLHCFGCPWKALCCAVLCLMPDIVAVPSLLGMQAKEGEMQHAYQRLTAACSERSTIRRALIDSQASNPLLFKIALGTVYASSLFLAKCLTDSACEWWQHSAKSSQDE